MNATERLQRTTGLGRVGFAKNPAGQTVLTTLHQAGAAKFRLPAVYGSEHAEAVMINTAGGLTDGDLLETDVTVQAGADAVVTTQACERIYRAASDEPARILNSLSVSGGAKLAWLPQETILFDGGRVVRSTSVELSDDADFLGVESLILGRESMGEAVKTGALRDHWRIRRGERLIFADGFSLNGDVGQTIDRLALLSGYRYLSTIICCRANLDSVLEAVRQALAEAGAASVFGDKLIARIACDSGPHLREVLGRVLGILMDGRPLPRVWNV
ncbi:MAG: urease accessory protein UreD [Pseudomonadota bacterium]